MMKKIIPFIFLSGAIGLLLSGCVCPLRTEFAPPPAVVFTCYKAPLVMDYDKTPVGNRSGRAFTQYIYDFFITGAVDVSWGDSSLNKATRNGRITKVGTGDYSFLNILGIYEKTTVHVYQAPQTRAAK